MIYRLYTRDWEDRSNILPSTYLRRNSPFFWTTFVEQDVDFSSRWASSFLFFLILYFVFFLRLPGSGSLGGGPGSSSVGLVGLRGFGCPSGLFLPLAPLRLT